MTSKQNQPLTALPRLSPEGSPPHHHIIINQSTSVVLGLMEP